MTKIFLEDEAWVVDIKAHVARGVCFDASQRKKYLSELLELLEKGKFERFKRSSLLLINSGDYKAVELFRERIMPRFVRADLLDKFADCLRVMSKIQGNEFSDPTLAEYLLSVANYAAIYKLVNDYEFVIHRGLKNKPGIIRMLLNLVTKVYWWTDPKVFIDYNSGKTDFYPDVFVDGVSYVLALVNKGSEINLASVLGISESKVSYRELERIISIATQIKRLREVEVLINKLGCVISCENGVYVLTPQKEELAIGIMWAHKRDYWANFSENNLASSLATKMETASLEKVYKDSYEAIGENCWFPIYDKPFERLAFIAPLEMYIDKLKEIFQKDGLFEEEIRFVVSAEKEFCVRADEFLDKKLLGNMTFKKLIKIFRVLKFFTYSLKRKIEEIKKDKPIACENTQVLFWTRERLTEFFVMFGFTEQDVDDLLSIVTTDLAANKYVDLIYRPIVKVGPYYCIVLGALDVYKIPRTTLKANEIRFYDDGTIEPVIRTLEEKFRRITTLIKTNEKYQCEGQSGEIDFLACYEKRLFVFEGKSTLMPYGSIEMRTMINHLEKAASQLSRIKKYLANDVSGNALMKRFNWEVSIDNITYGILVNNRPFGGTKYKGCPVVHVNELGSFIKSGEVIVTNSGGDDANIVKLWKGETITAEDIDSYVNGDTFMPALIKHIKWEYGDAEIGGVKIRTKYCRIEDEDALLKDMSTRNV